MLSEALVSVYTRRVTGRRHVFIEYNKVVQAGNNIVHCTDCTSPGSRCSMKKQNISIFLHWLGSLKICSNFYRNEYLELDYRTLFIKIISIKHCIVLSKIFISKNNSKKVMLYCTRLSFLYTPWSGESYAEAGLLPAGVTCIALRTAKFTQQLER